MNRLQKELSFLKALWTANFLAAMEYRAAFLTQMVGMILNNGAYFLFWVIYFDRFKQVGDWALNDMLVLYGIAAASFGLTVVLFGNIMFLSEIITKGQLDYYLSLPRPVLLHILASRSSPSGLGDFIYGIGSFLIAGQFGLDTVLRFALGITTGMMVFLGFLTIVHSLAFTMGSANQVSGQAFGALITFSLYPSSLFEGGARFILYILIPAAYIGTVPTLFVKTASWANLAQMGVAAFILLTLGIITFRRGLRKYESGSAIQAQI